MREEDVMGWTHDGKAGGNCYSCLCTSYKLNAEGLCRQCYEGGERTKEDER